MNTTVNNRVSTAKQVEKFGTIDEIKGVRYFFR